MRVSVDLEVCQGTAFCEMIAPDVFGMEDGHAIVLVDGVPDELADAALEAEESCPTKAISIEG